MFILDPCCGTGAYLVEVLRVIAATLADKGEDALLGGKLKAAHAAPLISCTAIRYKKRSESSHAPAEGTIPSPPIHSRRRLP